MLLLQLTIRAHSPTDAAEGTVPPVAGAAVNAAVPSAEAGAMTAPPADAVGKIVPPVAGAAAVTAADAAPAEDAGASAPPFDDTAEKTRVPITAAAARAAAASATAVGADCCGPSAVDVVCFGGCCRCPSDRENIGISISSYQSHSLNGESEITALAVRGSL